MPEETAARVTGRGEELDRALSEAKTWAEANKKPDDAEGLAAWNAASAPMRRAIREAHQAAPVSTLGEASAADWRKAFDEAEKAADMKGAALALARRGFLIFPCDPRHKGPHTILGPIGGSYWATDSPVDIEAWWTLAPHACIGLLMGRRTGLFAIDIDTPSAHNVDGRMNFTRLCDDLGLPGLGGRSHRTANDGVHILFKWYEGGPQYKISPLKVGETLYEGVEIIGDGAFIVIPPSKLVDGKQYTVRDNKVPPLPPKKLITAIKGDKTEKVKKIREQPAAPDDAKWDPDWCGARLAEAVEAIRATVKGTYDLTASVALKIGSIVAGGGLDDAAARAALSEAASAADKPRDYLAKVLRAYEKGKENPWTPKQQFIRWPDWYGKPLSTYMNAITALDNMDVALYYDVLEQSGMMIHGGKIAAVKDATIRWVRAEIYRRFKFDPGREHTTQAVTYLCEQLSVHTFCEQLDKLVWDGKRRLARLFPSYFGAEDTLYTRVIGVYFLMSIVARAYRPGCKSDYMVVLEGGQGLYKSQACRALVSETYFAENLPSIQRKDALEQLRGKVLIELPEIVNLIEDDPEGFKAFLTRQTDRFRISYGHYAEDFPRGCVFIGTTNRDHWLDDPTGARRFWPIRVGVINLKAIATDRDQLLAEAVDRYKRGRHWWPSPRLEARVFVREQAARQMIDEREADIQAWIIDEASRQVNGRAGLSVKEIWDNREWGKRGFTATEIWKLALKMPDNVVFGTTHQRQVVKCLKRLGCKQPHTTTSRRYWLPPPEWKTSGGVFKSGQDDIPF